MVTAGCRETLAVVIVVVGDVTALLAGAGCWGAKGAKNGANRKRSQGRTKPRGAAQGGARRRQAGAINPTFLNTPLSLSIHPQTSSSGACPLLA